MKESYNAKITELISEVKKYNKLLSTEKEQQISQFLARKNQKKLDDQLRKEAQAKEISEKHRLEQEHLLQERLKKKNVKHETYAEWVQKNRKSFELRKDRITEELEKMKEQTKIQNELENKLTEQRYTEILSNKVKAKEISNNMRILDFKRNKLLKEIQDRKIKEEEENKLPKLTALDIIKERLKQSETIKLIDECFDFQDC